MPQPGPRFCRTFTLCQLCCGPPSAGCQTRGHLRRKVTRENQGALMGVEPVFQLAQEWCGLLSPRVPSIISPAKLHSGDNMLDHWIKGLNTPCASPPLHGWV